MQKSARSRHENYDDWKGLGRGPNWQKLYGGCAHALLANLQNKLKKRLTEPCLVENTVEGVKSLIDIARTLASIIYMGVVFNVRMGFKVWINN